MPQERARPRQRLLVATTFETELMWQSSERDEAYQQRAC